MDYNDELTFYIIFIALNLFLAIVNFLRGSCFTATMGLIATAVWAIGLVMLVYEYNNKRRK